MFSDRSKKPDPLPLPTFQPNIALGIGLVLLAIFFFGCLEVSAKLATTYMPPMQVVWARYMIHTVLMVVFLAPFVGRKLIQTRRPKLQISRSVLLVTTTMCQFTGLSYLQLAEVTTINFAAPFFVAVLAGLLLAERPGPHRWGAIIVGFCGVVLAMRPGGGEVHWAYFIVLGSAIGMGFYLITTRMVADVDNAWASLFYTAIIGAVVMCFILPFVWRIPTHWMGWLMMVAVGFFGAVGHFLLIIASRYAPPTLLAPFMYVQIVWAVLFGFLVFGDLPDTFTWAGAVVVILSGLYLAWRETRAARRAKQSK